MGNRFNGIEHGFAGTIGVHLGTLLYFSLTKRYVWAMAMPATQAFTYIQFLLSCKGKTAAEVCSR